MEKLFAILLIVLALISMVMASQCDCEEAYEACSLKGGTALSCGRDLFICLSSCA
ncbi:hypothetical protein PPL_12007 [Heterostelium album PN500]|uniref:Uncharacterized protein n=1 Tax=Heterostelium pallidum (strain ATCC 26659 / Pp 5 / PN500) TaxID=670386 RepID=D3BV35_HETP5|nr:hypothetical protein PPL_12007 [Heterostelium album PN500]EFA74973.1 hypothetical protein PPL_12007 [Heterostelium album PN500]|eukprot:XP_020427107.1 hypothetical protein PPL_12007 [Heterostelium album PN500]